MCRSGSGRGGISDSRSIESHDLGPLEDVLRGGLGCGRRHGLGRRCCSHRVRPRRRAAGAGSTAAAGPRQGRAVSEARPAEEASSERLLLRSRELIDGLPADPLKARLLSELATVQAELGFRKEARETGRRAVEIAEAITVPSSTQDSGANARSTSCAKRRRPWQGPVMSMRRWRRKRRSATNRRSRGATASSYFKRSARRW